MQEKGQENSWTVKCGTRHAAMTEHREHHLGCLRSVGLRTSKRKCVDAFPEWIRSWSFSYDDDGYGALAKLRENTSAEKNRNGNWFGGRWWRPWMMWLEGNGRLAGKVGRLQPVWRALAELEIGSSGRMRSDFCGRLEGFGCLLELWKLVARSTCCSFFL